MGRRARATCCFMQHCPLFPMAVFVPLHALNTAKSVKSKSKRKRLSAYFLTEDEASLRHQFLTTVKGRPVFPKGPFEAAKGALLACQRGPERSPSGNFHFVTWACRYPARIHGQDKTLKKDQIANYAMEAEDTFTASDEKYTISVGPFNL